MRFSRASSQWEAAVRVLSHREPAPVLQLLRLIQDELTCQVVSGDAHLIPHRGFEEVWA